MVAAFGESVRGEDPLVKRSSDARQGDYQSNVAMSLSKKLGLKPRDTAVKIVEHLRPMAAEILDLPDDCVAGPGFINLRLSDAFLTRSLTSIPPASSEDDRLGVEPVDESARQTVVVDYSSPNVAKEMHVGHLRSTIIGDTLVRVLSFQGHRLIRQNHIGDWGTQFGKVILALWYLCFSKETGESPDDYDRLATELSDLTQSNSPKKLELLRERAAIHQRILDQDPDGSKFHAFIGSLEPSFSTLLPAYRFVNALESAAAGTDIAIKSTETGEARPLSELARYVAAMLQGKAGGSNDQELAAWQKAKDATLRECNELYRRLGVLLRDEDVCGESFYEPLLPFVVKELQTALATTEGQTGDIKAVCRRDQGAVCVFLEKSDGSPAYKGAQGDPLPMIIQKSDGASLYATTDLAAALYRCAHPKKHPVKLNEKALADTLASLGGGLGADRVIYHVGVPQKLHFEMLFATVHALGWTRKPDGTSSLLEHVSFGSVLGEDRKMLRTRAGGSVRLKDLLNEAVDRAEEQVRAAEADPDRARGFSEDEIRNVSEVVGIGAVKYADLLQNRNTDYVFNWSKMLAMQGNTAPYMLYAYARIRSIYRKGAEEGISQGVELQSAPIVLGDPAERALASTILRLPEVVDSIAEHLMPNYLCDYLFDLAGKFMAFYENCPVLKAPDAATAASRLRLCDLAARALKLGLGLLGIPVLERM